MKKNCKREIKQIEKILNKKSDKQHVKWKDFEDPFNRGIDKKDIII